MQLRCNLDGIKKIKCKKIFGKNQKNHRFLFTSNLEYKKITCHLNTFSKKQKIAILIVFPSKLDAL